MSTFDPSLTLKLSIQRALLAEVTSRMVAVTCGLQENLVSIVVYFRGAVTLDDINRVGIIGAEVTADFTDGYQIEELCKSADEAEPEMLDFWAFYRARD